MNIKKLNYSDAEFEGLYFDSRTLYISSNFIDLKVYSFKENYTTGFNNDFVDFIIKRYITLKFSQCFYNDNFYNYFSITPEYHNTSIYSDLKLPDDLKMCSFKIPIKLTIK